MTDLRPGSDPIRCALLGWVGAVLWGVLEVGWIAGLGGLAPGIPAVVALLVVALVVPGLPGAVVATVGTWRRPSSVRAVLLGFVTGLAITCVAGTVLPAGPHDPSATVTPIEAALLAATGLLLGLAVLTRGAARLLVGYAIALGAVLLPFVHGRRPLAPAPGTGPSVLLITIDGARADRYDDPRVATPATDRVAAEGVRYGLAMSPTPRPGAALASLHLGEPRESWADDGVTLAEALRARGYRTAAFVSSLAVHRDLGAARGFSVFDDDLAWVKGLRDTPLGRLLGLRRSPPAERRAAETVDRAVGWLERAEGPWLAWVHLADPRAPYEPPPPWDARYYPGSDPTDGDPAWIRARYDGEVAYTDAQVERLLDVAGPRAWVVVVGSAGELLGDEAGPVLEEAALHVPLAVRVPGAEPRRVDVPIETWRLYDALLEGLSEGWDPEAIVPPDGIAVSTLDGRRSVRDARGRLTGGRYWRISSQGVATEADPSEAPAPRR